MERMRQRATVYAAAVVLWPAVLLALLGWAPFLAPIPATVSTITLLCLCFEITGYSVYTGPLTAYEGCDAVYERGVQVSAVAFAVASLLLSQRDDDLAKVIGLPVFLALLFCTLSAVPSSLARRRVGATGHWNALQKVAVSYAAALLCLSVALCLHILTQVRNGRDFAEAMPER